MADFQLPDDPVVRELLPEFIDDWIRQLDEDFPSIFAAKDAAAMRRFGHTIKGSCFQFGLPHIAELGIRLMHLAEEQQWEQIEPMRDQIREEFVKVKEALGSQG